VELSVPLRGDLALTIADRPTGNGFPTARLQKGPLLFHEGRDLAEEGVGFGVPVLKRGALTIFPGGVELAERRDGTSRVIVAAFRMDLVERLADAEGRGPTSGSFYAVRDLLAALHRRLPLLRGPLTATSNAVRRRHGWVTTFAQTGTVATLDVSYRIESDRPRLHIAVDMTGLPEKGFTEMVVMNELGARHFDRYMDSDGARLRGRQIGTWREVAAARAAFVGTSSGVAFSVGQVPGAKLFRGWELVGSRLAWSGFGYVVRPAREPFSYDVRLEKAP
jgi:hypothetical protein